MIEIFFCSVLITVLFAPYGFYFIKDFKPDIYHFSKKLIFSSIFLSFCALTLNFFLPLNILVTSTLLILSIFLIFKNKKYFVKKNFLIFVILQSFIISILILESDVYRPDAGLYHLPFIGILNSEKIIFGLSNLHFRYGHISIIQYFSAVSNNILFNSNGIVFASALIASSVLINLSSHIYNYIKLKNYNFHFFFIFFVFIYICYKMNRYGEYGNDAPAHFLLFFLVSELLLKIKKIDHQDFNNNLILTLFIIQNKLTLIFVIFLNFIFLKKINLLSLIKDKRFIFLSTFFTFWIIKNVFTTGCLLYPVHQTCFENLIWTDMDGVKKVSLSSEAWTKDWSNFENKSKITQIEFLENFKWLEIWSKNHLKLIVKILLPYIIFCIFLIILLTLNNKKTYSKIDNIYLYFFLILLFGSLTWFLKSPLYRYGYSFLICTISFIFAYYCSKFNLNQKKHNVIFISILIFGIISFITKNIIRINNTNNSYYNYPWPKYYSMDSYNNLTKFKTKKIEEKYILTPVSGYCMYIKKICSHYPLEDNFKIKMINNYYIFHLGNKIY